MKHTRVPRTEAGIFCGLLSKHRRYQAFTFLKPNPKSDRKSNRKPNGPNRKSNRIKQEKIPHTLCQVKILLGLIDVVHCLHYLRREPSVVLKTSLPVVEFNLLLAIEDQAHIKRVCLVQTLYQHRSALPYMACCTLSSCSSTKGPRTLGLTIRQTKA